jgi:hypothetical protein
MFTRSTMLMSVAHRQRPRSRLRRPGLSAALTWVVWQRDHSALMVARVDQMRADHLRRYRANRGPWL